MSFKSKLFISIAALALLAMAWIILFNKDSNVEPGVALPETLTHEQRMQASEAITELRQAKKEKDEEGTLSATLKFAQAIGGKAGGMLSMAASRILPVHFWGRVVDQHGVGVANARVDLVISGGGSFATSTGSTYVSTDSQGYFEVKGKGQDVSILDVKHKNVADVYYRSRGGKKAYGNKDLRATNQHGEEYSWYSYEKKESPLIIDVWRVEKFDNVKANNGAYHVPVNGEALLFDKTIKATCQRSEMNGFGDYGDWSITLAPLEGGVQETEDLYLNVAPESGYLPEFTLSSKREDSEYLYRIYPAKHFYYYAKGGSVYGSLEISFEPFAKKDKCILMTAFKYNKSGSRNLAMRKPR